MARTPLYSRLRRTFSMVLWGRREGVTDPAELPRAFARAELERRTFLRGAAASLAALGAPALATSVAACGDDGGNASAEENVAVIGGGIAGVHCAYRLHEQSVKVTVYEASKRFGGRMYSSRDQFADGQLCELGGELIDTNHATLFALADELGLVLDDRWADEPTPFARDTWFVNGAVVPDATIVEQFTAVAPTIEAASEAADADEDQYAALDAIDLGTWIDTNVPVSQYAELNAILKSAYLGEFGLELAEQSSLNMIYLIGADDPDPFRIFGESDERYHTHLGNDSFPTLLAQGLPDAQKKLEYKLVAAREVSGGYELDFETPQGTKTEKATRIVFALPFSVLREVDLTGLTLSDEKHNIIQTLGYGTNAKVMAGFSERVWRTQHAASGSLTCDLPIQQTWETSIGQDGASGILTNFLSGKQGLASGNGTEDAWVEGVLPDLEQVWPGTTAAYTGKAVRMHWPTVPTHKGSYTCYKVGQWSFFGLEGQREGNLHFCGEHTSQDFQGWMEGGAETGALVAAEILDDVGTSHSEGLRRALGVKLLLPQSTYRAQRYGRLGAFQRRRLVRAIFAEHGLRRPR